MPSEEEEKLVALRAEVAVIKKNSNTNARKVVVVGAMEVQEKVTEGDKADEADANRSRPISASNPREQSLQSPQLPAYSRI